MVFQASCAHDIARIINHRKDALFKSSSNEGTHTCLLNSGLTASDVVILIVFKRFPCFVVIVLFK